MWRIKVWIYLDVGIPFLQRYAYEVLYLSIKQAVKKHKKEEGGEVTLKRNYKEKHIYIEYTTKDEKELEDLKQFEEKLKVDFDALMKNEQMQEQLAQQNKFLKRFWHKIKYEIIKYKEIVKQSISVKYEVEKI